LYKECQKVKSSLFRDKSVKPPFLLFLTVLAQPWGYTGGNREVLTLKSTRKRGKGAETGLNLLKTPLKQAFWA